MLFLGRIVALLIFSTSLCALEFSYHGGKSDNFNQSDSAMQSFQQWFTGPLLVPSPITMNPKHPAFEPSITCINTYGFYDNNWKNTKPNDNIWSLLYLAYWQLGFSKHFGMDIVASLTSNYSKHASSTHFTDTIVRLGYQILNDTHQKGNWTPNLRFLIQEIFPTGKYQNLNPLKSSVDATGQGSFQTGAYLAAEKGFLYTSAHPFNLYLAFGYLIPASYKVNGRNYYGGDQFTKGRVYPGNVISIYFSGEVALSKHLAFAFDSNYQQNLAGFFKKKDKYSSNLRIPQLVNINFAPELEITVGQKAAFLIGPWLTLAGQNTPSFVSFFVAFLMFF